MNPRIIVASDLFIQAVGTAAWWALLLSVWDSVPWFQPGDWPVDALLGFRLADSILLIGGSIVVAGEVVLQKPWAVMAIWSLVLCPSLKLALSGNLYDGLPVRRCQALSTD